MADTASRDIRAGWLAMAAIGLIVAVTGMAMLARPMVGVANIAFLYLIPVILLAQRGGLWPGLGTAALATLAFNYFFVPPAFTLRVAAPDNIVTLAIFAGVAAAVSSVAGRLRGQALTARRMAAESAELAALSQQLAGLSDEADIRHALARRLSDWTGATVRLIAPENLDGDGNAMSPLDRAAARWAFEHGEPAGRGSPLMPGADAYYAPLRIGTESALIAGFWRGEPEAPVAAGDLGFVAQALARGGDALHRAGLAARQAEIEGRQRQEAMREALLASISHDLRTPLTGILAGLDAIAAGDAPAIGETRQAVERLDRMVGNLLDLARLRAPDLNAERQPIDLTDAIDAAIRDLAPLLSDDALELFIEPDLPLVAADPRMLHHMLINLIDNAAKYGGEAGPILIQAHHRDDGVSLAVLDSGCGLPTEGAGDLFALFQRGANADSRRGNGLGLAVVDGFAQAMGLHVSARNREGGGAIFEMHFPRDRIAATIAGND